MQRCLSIAVVLILFLCGPAAALEVPSPTGYVNDRANILSAGTVRELERQLQDFEASDSTQIVVLTVPSLDGAALEEYSLQVAQNWGIGQRGRDNGALLLIAVQDRAMRIEVGYGLEGRLTDLLAGRIIDDEITPRFRQSDFDGGVQAGVAAMIQAVRGEYQGSGRTGDGGDRFGWLVLLLFLGPWLALTRRARGGRRGGIWYGGGFGGGGFGGGGGGGFSGGGGSFGGGGASGRW